MITVTLKVWLQPTECGKGWSNICFPDSIHPWMNVISQALSEFWWTLKTIIKCAKKAVTLRRGLFFFFCWQAAPLQHPHLEVRTPCLPRLEVRTFFFFFFFITLIFFLLVSTPIGEIVPRAWIRFPLSSNAAKKKYISIVSIHITQSRIGDTAIIYNKHHANPTVLRKCHIYGIYLNIYSKHFDCHSNGWMATTKMHYANFRGNGQSYASLTELFVHVFTGPKYTCMSQIVLITGRKHRNKFNF